MNKPGAATLVGTLLALVVATVWVPVVPRPSIDLDAAPRGTPAAVPPPWLEWERVNMVLEGGDPSDGFPDDVEWRGRAVKFGEPRVRWNVLALIHGRIIAVGGLLALHFRTRRGEA